MEEYDKLDKRCDGYTKVLHPAALTAGRRAATSEGEGMATDDDHAPPLAVTVLGSGGPTVNPHRASVGYLVEVDGAPSLLVDAGGGVFERFGRRGADPARLEAILLTHLHADHSGELAPIVFAAYLGGRRAPLRVMGPAGRSGATGACRFIDLLFGERGAWRDLRGFAGFGLDVTECPAGDAGRCPPMSVAGVTVRAAPVPHRTMPTVAYRIEHDGCSLVVSGDVSRESDRLVDLAAGCDVLVCDMGRPDEPVGSGHLQAAPGEVGRMAAASGCGLLVLSHLTPEMEARMDDALARVRRHYGGPLLVAEDLVTLRVGGHVRRRPPSSVSAAVTGVPS